MLHELTESAASSERQLFEDNPAPTWLARVQNGILALDEESVEPQPEDDRRERHRSACLS